VREGERCGPLLKYMADRLSARKRKGGEGGAE